MSRSQLIQVEDLERRLKEAQDHADLMERTFFAMADVRLGKNEKRGSFSLRVWRAGDIHYPIMAVDKPDLIDVQIDLKDGVDATKFGDELTLVLEHLGLRLGKTL